jgi:putative nucleotidyltransferase with HDIG domain
MTSSSLPSANGSSGGFPSASASGSGGVPRDRLASVVRPRPRVGALLGLLLAFGFAALVAPAVTAESWLGATVEVNKPAPITVRVPPFAGADDGPRGGGVVIGRGEVPGLGRAGDAQEVLARQPRPLPAMAAYFVILFALAAIYSHHCRRSNRGRLLRVQLINLGVLAASAVAIKVLMLTTTMSVLAVPVALAAIVPTLVLDRTVGLATGVLAALVMSLVVPFDLGVATILLAQASIAGLIVPDRQRSPITAALLGGAAAAIGAALTYGIYLFLSTGVAPWGELSTPMSSPWVAAVIGGALSLVLVPLAIPLYQLFVGEITHGKLVRLEDLAHPMLRQIATKAPGTWQHSLAMANMAELAANAIGANGRLVRVGAYFHDLGKSLQPKYFIENLEAGEVSPHEKLPPEVSCDAIFAHVTEGLTTARRAKLPERIIDFMHMHHGNGVLEYFWARCQEQGNPNRRTIEDFRYPGVPPQSRETAILAICDAVEAASRTLKRADEQAIGSLVQRIVYGKLHLGQLDDSGLSMADLRRISDSLRETIKHAHHGRIEYPWQRAEAAEAAAASGATTAPATPKESTTQRMMKEPRLDSLDAPRPMWQRAATESSSPGTATGDPQIGVATTAVMGGGADPVTTQPAKRSAKGAAPSEPPPLSLSPSQEMALQATGPMSTLQGREAAPSGRSKPPMTPSEAAISVAPTFPPVDSLPPASVISDEPEYQPPQRASAATVATPSTVMAAVVANPLVGIAPTTLPGVTKDSLTPPPLEARVTAKRQSQPHPEQAGDIGRDPTAPSTPSGRRETRAAMDRSALASPPTPKPHGERPQAGSRPPPPPPGSPARSGDSRPPQGKTHVTVDHFPPPVEDAPSGDVIAARPRPAPVSTSADTSLHPTERPRRGRQPAMIIEDAPPARPPASDAENASTQPRMPLFRPPATAQPEPPYNVDGRASVAPRPSGVLPLPAPPPSDPEIIPPEPRRPAPRSRRPSDWSEGLAARVDRAFEDEVANSTPVHGPSPEEIASLAGKPEQTRLTPIHDLEQLRRESISEDTADEDVPLFEGFDRASSVAPHAGRTEPRPTVDANGRPFEPSPADTMRSAPPSADSSAAMRRARTVPPPPPGSELAERRSRTTEEVEPELIEASIEEVPRVHSGPPPSTRSTSRVRRVKPTE